MLKVKEVSGNTIYYSCDCGTNGRCLIRPLGEGNKLVLDLSCASCGTGERLVLIQELDKDESYEDADMSWSLVLTNDIIY